MIFRGAVVFGLLFMLLTLAGFAAAKSSRSPADPVTGLWYTEDRDGIIQLYPCKDKICGRFYWVKDAETNGDMSHDTHNPDSDLRARPLCGLTFMTGFVPDGKSHYADGTIYSPRHGANFSAEMTLADHDTLDLRGYMLTSLLGETQVWKRAAGDAPKCRVPDTQ